MLPVCVKLRHVPSLPSHRDTVLEVTKKNTMTWGVLEVTKKGTMTRSAGTVVVCSHLVSVNGGHLIH